MNPDVPPPISNPETGKKPEFSKADALKLIEERKPYEVIDNLDKFEGLDQEIALMLIEKSLDPNNAGGFQFGNKVIANLDKFVGVDYKLIDKFFEKEDKTYDRRHNGLLTLNLDKLQGLNSYIALKLIDNGEISSVLYYIKNFHGLSQEVATKLFEAGEFKEVAYHLANFSELDKGIALKLIESGFGDKVLNRLEKFKELDTEVALKLIDAKTTYATCGKFVAEKLEQFGEIDRMKVANKLIDSGFTDSIVSNIYNFGKFDSLTVNKLIDAGKGGDITYYFSGSSEEVKKMFDLDISVANNLIAHREHYAVLNHPDLFPEVSYQNLIEKIIESGSFSRSLMERLNEFKDLDYKKIIDKLIETENTRFLDNSEESDKFVSPKSDLSKYFTSEMIDYIKGCQNNKDNGDVYKLRDKYPLNEITSNYNYFRVKSWEEEGVLKPEDNLFFKELKEIIDEEILGKLWEKNNKDEMHIIGPEILKMLRVSGYSKDTFRGQFIERIARDNSSYGQQELPALRHFHQISQSFYEPEIETDIETTLAEASSFEQTKILAEMFKKEGPLKDWETLKKFYELAELLKQKEVLEKLENLKIEGKEKQYKFFSSLAFHPGSKIPMQTVFQFMEDPARFLDVEDVHASEAHERKKPSNYTKFPYLDITAEGLRDALIEGNLDKLQYFKPFEAGYKIADNNYSNQEIIKLLQEGLGSFREKITGNAKNPGKLFKITQEIFKKYNLEYNSVVENPLLLSKEARGDLEKALFDNDFGIKDGRKFEEYLVKIYPKSSPEGHLAGNDTACCMPFGSGKNNVYMYNLGCSILTVQRKVVDKYRTIAQSVLTPDVDIKHNISDLVNKVQDEALLSNIITEDLTQKKKIIITADNIEVSPNADKYKKSIEAIYADFVSRYAHAIESKEIEKDRMLIGKGYSDLNFSRSKSIDNTFIPTTPVAYSDNYGDEVYELPLSEKSEIIPLPNYGMLQKQEKETIDKDLPKGVSYLTAHDTLRVSYMEGKIYAENESLVQYIHRIGNELTAKDINNSFKNRPNLSFKIEDENNTMLGYMIAYEGVEKEDSKYEDGDPETRLGEKVIYISDLAVDTKKSKLSGGRLINAFGVIINREYLSRGIVLPIVAQAREKTSYKIIQNHLDDLGKKYGYRFRLEERGSYESGDDTMHEIKLVPEKI